MTSLTHLDPVPPPPGFTTRGMGAGKEGRTRERTRRRQLRVVMYSDSP